MMLDTFLTQLPPRRPVLLVDADEVLLRYIDMLMAYFESRGARLGEQAFRLHGNVVDMETGRMLSNEAVNALLRDVWRDRGGAFEAVPGAAEALNHLSEDWTIAVLTNVPAPYREARARNLADLGMPYPVIANESGKGPAVARVLEAAGPAPVAFVDDLPPQHASVAAHAPDAHRIHYVYHPVFSQLIGKADEAHIRLQDWQEIQNHLTRRLEMP